MRQLFLLIYQYRAFVTFILLEIVSFWLILGSSKYHNAAFFNTSNNLIANVYTSKQNVYRYLNLIQVNDDLSKENAFLRDLIDKQKPGELPIDSLEVKSLDSLDQFEYIPAKVINNSTRKINNYITINKGAKDGLEPGMGVISTKGIVGVIKTVSNKYATIYSLLHSDIYVSSVISRLNVFCTIKWQGENPLYANLLYVPRHVQLQLGDTIMTSGFNAIFPENIPIGTIHDFSIDENQSFYNINTNLASDFSSVSYVYLIKNKFKQEKDSIELINE